MSCLVRPSTAEDRPRIREILLGSELFKPSDAECVDEMFGLALARPAPDNYRFLSGWVEGQMMGFACYGWEYLTRGTWDLFWVCTLPAIRRRGLGSALLGEAVRVATEEAGRLMVIYTSSTPKYDGARQLYEKHQFMRTAVIPNYYDQADDLYIYTRDLARPAAGEKQVLAGSPSALEKGSSPLANSATLQLCR